jgi:NADH:ubiquinone oxidoreductase subunit 5 (subunit L)/multisubunit Na+/H+ antiporter MnhA subunit
LSSSPLIGFLIAGLFGRLIGARGSEIVTTSLLVVSAVLSWIAFFSMSASAAARPVSKSRPGWRRAICASTGPSGSTR